MKEDNILPYEGEAVLIDDSDSDFDWPAVTRTLIETMPWQVEMARIFGREMPVPRMTAWFGDAAYAYSGVCHQPAPLPAIIQRLRERAEVLSGALFNSVLLNLYRHGRDSVGWHSDNEAGLGDRPTIASLSLGGARRFQFRHRIAQGGRHRIDGCRGRSARRWRLSGNATRRRFDDRNRGTRRNRKARA